MDITIPIWPDDTRGSRRMTFLFGEARWYLWMQEENLQDMYAYRRDLLLLHQNGDLKLIKSKKPPSIGMFVAAYHEGKMIRGRIIASNNSSDTAKEDIVHVVDVDEGKHLYLQINQLRSLPSEMRNIPVQAIRCDIGLDCTESVQWPAQVNDMLCKYLKGAVFAVEKIGNRPGSIPTISAKITFMDSATGKVFDLQRRLIEDFSRYLRACSLEKFSPFPVGMTPTHVETYLQSVQKNLDNLSLQGTSSCGPPGLFGPPGMIYPSPPNLLQPLGFIPSSQCPFPLLPPPQLPSSVFPLHQIPTFSSPSPPLQLSDPTPPPVHSLATSSIFPFHQIPTFSSPSPPLQLSDPTPSPVHSLVPSQVEISNTCNRRLSLSSLSSTSTSLYLSDTESSKESKSTVGIDLDTLDSSSSNSIYSSAVALSRSSMGPQNDESILKESSLCDETKSFGRGNRRKVIATNSSSSSSLSPEAKPFVPRLKNATANVADRTEIVQDLISKDGAVSTLKSEQSLLGLSKNSGEKGKGVKLAQIVRHWKVGEVIPAIIARVWNPSCFEVNVVDDLSGELEIMKEEMNKFYESNRIKISSKHQAQDICGDFCACYDAEDKIWFRAEVHEWFLDDSVAPLKVWAVDYGGFSWQDLSSIQPLVEGRSTSLPILVTLCSMTNIEPRSDDAIWPETHLERVKELLPEDKLFFLRIDGIKLNDDIWPVSVFSDQGCAMDSINEILVSEGCASYVGFSSTEMSEQSSENLVEWNPMKDAYNVGHNNYELDDEDACVAVSGHKFSEESGICWFFERNGYCYKKLCTLKHVKLNPQGYSIAKEELYANTFSEIDVDILAPGKQVKLKVTRILTVHHFIALLILNKVGTSRETLKSLLMNLNSKEMKRSLKTFSEFPADGEVVLAQGEDGMFYRGRVIMSGEDDTIYEVLNVDSGKLNMVPLANLRKVDPAFLHHPFHAIECWLADVAPVHSERSAVKQCNQIFAQRVQGRTLTATILRSSIWGIEINLFDKEGNDLSVELKEIGIIKDCPMRHLPSSNCQKLPG